MFELVELCGMCAHGLEGHLGRPCNNTDSGDGQTCPCPRGIRTDAFMNKQLADIWIQLRSQSDLMLKMTILLQIMTNQEVELTHRPDGNTDVCIKPFTLMSKGLILPGH